MDEGTDLGVASILIPKTIRNGIRGCFISHPQKNNSKQFKTESGVASFFIPKTSSPCGREEK
jgi:hypothetical protein